MTITINIPTNAESGLQREAAATGLPIPTLIEHIVSERFDNAPPRKESSREFFDRVARPGPSVDASREGIYADF